MIVIFLNLHQPTQEGKLKFDRYYSTITKILKQSIYYGTQYEQQILTRDKITDYLYDQQQRSNCQKARQKFKSVEYLFIQGPINLPPWSSSLTDVALLIRNCVKEQKKVHYNGFGHIALYHYLATGFDKQYCIKKKGDYISGKQDFFHEQETGDLFIHNKKVCNSGIQVFHNINKIFHRKSQQALDNGAVIPTKFHYLAFNAKNGDSLIKNIVFPFSFYQKHKVFCTPISQTRANITPLIETQNRIPIVFVYKKSLSTHLLCPETIKVFVNWLTNQQQVKPLRQILFSNIDKISEIAFDNRIVLEKNKIQRNFTMFSKREENQRSLKTLRPQTAASSKSKNTFDKPSVRCSGPYQSIDHIKTIDQINKKPMLLGRSRMVFKSQTEKLQIQNYVQRTPSRPPSAHNFRDINKAKWMDKRTFFVT